MNLIRRIVDIYRHYGNDWAYPTQRQYRLYLQGLNHATPAEPYRLTTIRNVREVPDVREDVDVTRGAPVASASSQSVEA